MKRVFVRGLSRSGGTLMVTVLDAHPELAMGYEIYEHLLGPAEGERDPFARFVADLERSLAAAGPRGVATAPGKLADGRLKTFVNRARRAGIDAARFLELLREHGRAGRGLADFADRMRFVERIALDKARREGKSGWGAKLASVYEETLELWPDAAILFMLRDGRDIAASRRAVGEFDQSIEEIARGYVAQVEAFEAFAGRHPRSARLVRYERLVLEPEAELRELVAFLGLPWSDRVLEHERQDLSLFRDPTGHLSAEQVGKPINTESIGRWREELSEEEVGAFERIAGALLDRHGFACARGRTGSAGS